MIEPINWRQTVQRKEGSREQKAVFARLSSCNPVSLKLFLPLLVRPPMAPSQRRPWPEEGLQETVDETVVLQRRGWRRRLGSLSARTQLHCNSIKGTATAAALPDPGKYELIRQTTLSSPRYINAITQKTVVGSRDWAQGEMMHRRHHHHHHHHHLQLPRRLVRRQCLRVRVWRPVSTA